MLVATVLSKLLEKRFPIDIDNDNDNDNDASAARGSNAAATPPTTGGG
jgi:hypothetical protein